MSHLKLKAKAIVAVRRRKKKEQDTKDALLARERAIETRLMDALSHPTPKDGRDGRDAPTLSDILAAIEIPAPIHTTVVQEVDPTDMEVFIRGMLPEVDPSDRPKVEQIVNETTIDISDEKLEGLVSQKEFKDALRRIQDAISANQSSGTSPSIQEQIDDNELGIEDLIKVLEGLITDLMAQGATNEQILKGIESHTEAVLKVQRAALMGIEIIADQEEGTLIEDINEE
jgi:hypothetical protein